MLIISQGTSMNYSRQDTHPAILRMLDGGISYDEILEPILLASCFQVELTQGSPSWRVQTYLSRSVVHFQEEAIIEIMWDDVGVHFNVITYHPKMLQIVGAVLRSINDVSHTT